MRRPAAALALAGAIALPSMGAQNPAARFLILSEVDCPGPAQIISETAQGPREVTYLRVQHIGDPGTDEWANEVANVVTWDVGSRTGYTPPPSENAQRGYRDATGDSAFQLGCRGAGFHIDTSRFSHTVPLVGEGPSASVTREFSPPRLLFGDGASLLFEATVALPTVATATPPVAEGTAQVSFFYYVRDEVSGGVFAHLIALFDNRPWGQHGVGMEYVGSDGVTAFVSSPLAYADPTGATVQYAAPGPASATMRTVEPWRIPVTFRAVVGYTQFEAMLARLRAAGMPQLSGRPANYRVLSFGILAEVFPGTTTSHEVALGGSVVDLALREQPASWRGPAQAAPFTTP